MAGGRPTKSIEELKRNGTFRKDLHGKREIAENKMKALPGPDTKKIKVPVTLKDKEIKDFYTEIISLLSQIKVLQKIDIPEITLMCELLQQINDMTAIINKGEILSENYLKATAMKIKLIQRYGEISKKYYVSPSVRTKLQLDNLELAEKKVKTKTLIEQLLEGKNELP